MVDHQQLKSKYERLCVEFKKLRTKYKTLKDNENELNQQLHEEILQKNLHIEKLKQEIEQLKQSLNNPIIPINGITYENSTKLSLLLNDNSSQLSCPTDTVAKKSITTQSETKDDSKLMAHSSQASNSNDPDQLSNSSNEKSDENSNAHKVIMKRLHTAIEESIYYASRANFLQDELESLIPWIIQLLYFYQKQQSKYHIIKQSNEQLKQQLELMKANTIKQINEMAKHINHLTNELQTLQLHSLSKHHNHLMNEQSQWNGLTNDNQVKKNTLFNILKK
ncbi:hypothetical protein Smp_170940 [Schistosoma mansoni]|uniref:hypothetical protein n=1 Tax=Schistosoma mansoni TaxID=6183 RepID=UPI0001A61CCE|nr:hypothetical protein Smp_170940 [Schistosoma mansoni]|eukprot:XP_018649645.1 hypothetical protein Smp_170940 [Schistosoma mansoni]